ncbi:MAG: SDR family NAD(P)-dependent oxidoreductase [Pseudomonadota bacterium]
MNYFKGKQAVITGASSGIGRALAQRLNAAGCDVWLADINSEGLAAVAAELDERRAQVRMQAVDVADKNAMFAWAAEIGAQAESVDLVVNNAGVALMAQVKDMSFDDFEWLMGINFWGVVYGSQAFLPLLEKSSRSHLVNVSSVFGMIAVPTQSAYNAAKFAVRGYTEALRQELDLASSPVKVCCVHPGGIATNIARSARNADPGVTADEMASKFESFAKTSPEEAARQILRAAEKGQRRLLIGRDARMIGLITRLFPARYSLFFRSETSTINEMS